MAFGFKKSDKHENKHEKGAMRPLSVMLQDNVKLFGKKKSIGYRSDKSVEPTVSEAPQPRASRIFSRQSFMLDSARRSLKDATPIMSRRTSSLYVPERASAGPEEPNPEPRAIEPDPKEPFLKLPSFEEPNLDLTGTTDKNDVTNHVAEAARNDAETEAETPFLTLSFDESHRRSLLNLSEHYSQDSVSTADADLKEFSNSSGQSGRSEIPVTGSDNLLAPLESKGVPGSEKETMGVKSDDEVEESVLQSPPVLSEDLPPVSPLVSQSSPKSVLKSPTTIRAREATPALQATSALQATPTLHASPKSSTLQSTPTLQASPTAQASSSLFVSPRASPYKTASLSTSQEESPRPFTKTPSAEASPIEASKLRASSVPASPTRASTRPSNRDSLDFSLTTPSFEPASVDDTSCDSEAEPVPSAVKARDTPVLFPLNEFAPPAGFVEPRVDERFLSPNRKVVFNRGVYIFDPVASEDVNGLALTEDDLFNPFD